MSESAFCLCCTAITGQSAVRACAVNRPNMSVVLTVISLGTRVLLSYTLSKISWLGVTGIWVSIPIGWFFADAVGILVYLRSRRLDEKG